VRKTLVVTMGGQAQVVTFALDALLRMQESIGEVVVIHLSPADHKISKALQQLASEFSNDFYHFGRVSCRLRRHLLKSPDGVPLFDVRSEQDAEVVWGNVRDLVKRLKRDGRSLHLVLAGGRRMIGLMALSSAMFYFGHQDRVWHMFTEPRFLEAARYGAILHDPTGEKVRLIQVPMVPWGAYFPTLRLLAEGTPAEAMAAQTRWLDSVERDHCRAVWQRLTPRQRDILVAFAEGLTPQEVAARSFISLKTVDSHKTEILGECRVAWLLPEDQYVDYHFLREHFGPFRPEMRRWS